LIVSALLLAMFLMLDLLLCRREGTPLRASSGRVWLRGFINFPLFAAIIGAIIISATWKPGVSFDVYGTKIELHARHVAIADIQMMRPNLI
jgi:hypothetical protein